jgi:hypothetical protein
MGTITIGKTDKSKPAKKAVKLPVQVVEKIVEVVKEIEVIKEVEVPVIEYVTVLKEEKVEVPVFHEVIREVEKIVEVPKIQIVKEPVYITKEVYNVEKIIKEQKAHKQTQKKLYLTTVALTVSVLLNFIIGILL